MATGLKDRCYALLRTFLGALPLPVQKALQRELVLAHRKPGTHFASLEYRPKSASRFGLVAAAQPSPGTVAIVVQGPLWREFGYTLETLRMYTRIHPPSSVILSTWDTEDAAAIEAIRGLGVRVVQSAKPSHPGMWNLNFQCTSTMAGLREAKAAGFTHALKTRTDQRMYHPDACSALLGLLAAYPCRTGDGQRERIAVASMNSYVYRPYSLSDMFTFGNLDDLLRYWDVPYNDERKSLSDYQAITLRKLLEVRCPEMAIVENFLDKLGTRIQGTLEDYHDIVQERFVVVDQGTVGLHWVKPFTHLEHVDRVHDRVTSHENWTFATWAANQAFREKGRAVRCDLDRTRIDGDVVC